MGALWVLAWRCQGPQMQAERLRLGMRPPNVTQQDGGGGERPVPTASVRTRQVQTTLNFPAANVHLFLPIKIILLQSLRLVSCNQNSPG